MSRHPFDKQDPASASPLRLRPKDAATLMLIDRGSSGLRVLLGKRGQGHAFMPNLYVFPGGRRDRSDHGLPFVRDLHPAVIEKLRGGNPEPAAQRRARALALAAVRELREETGLMIGRLENSGDGQERLCADLGCLRYVARAITPPGNVRRFDTRFFLAFTDEAGIDPADVRDSSELHDLIWLDIEAITSLNMPQITRTILEDVKTQMNADPNLPFGNEGPFYFSRRGQFMRGNI